ncbi:bifunctional diguanylate cyclase/phosphodiesterase [Leptolyngbya sp. CCNP1308]|uniref:putative bifunctional diguanylate cyclase/phosphodiesterase n=1 Tax=Leptolyngbya sp. CCNP1308 TaxID=3110255 RepID=UPI002B21B67E|nr:bifunctional diguanylate cyclase/phosphodiesterase [Leptolyngbya sp. CCNP1308]MEA5451945.1 bifunctional diguanylate cyclase/phosphodiesterase [Leptolyngbya sp. CCNP1308]
MPSLPTRFTDEVGTLMADTSQTLHQLDELMYCNSHYDHLTGLPNQTLLVNRLRETLSLQADQQRSMAVLLLSIDDFTDISHGLEPETLRLLLRGISQRLSKDVVQDGFLAYMGKDEFAIARFDVTSPESVVQLIQSLRTVLAMPFSLEGQTIHVTPSIGVILQTCQEAQDIDQLLQQAHMAMHQAKQRGRGQYQFYSPETTAQLQNRLVLENDLHKALERDELRVYYQPLIDLQTGQVIAVEALLRWQHPSRGLVSPAEFIPIAEANGLIVPIGEWVLRTACAQSRDWQLAGSPPLRMSVNLSACQFSQPNLVETVAQIMADTEMDPTYLELEVTESFLMEDMQRSVQTLQKLRSLGLAIALDDFGTGYSSLNYLSRFPVTMLKIDRSFVNDMRVNPESAAITDAIIALAKSLHLSITAEGIEDQEQLAYLKERGCEEGQGFYFSRPLPAAALEAWLQTKTLAQQLPSLAMTR